MVSVLQDRFPGLRLGLHTSARDKPISLQIYPGSSKNPRGSIRVVGVHNFTDAIEPLQYVLGLFDSHFDSIRK
jgi:hypothetical protein